MFCIKCGAKLEEGAKFCTVCGAPAYREEKESRPKSAGGQMEKGRADEVGQKEGSESPDLAGQPQSVQEAPKQEDRTEVVWTPGQGAETETGAASGYPDGGYGYGEAGADATEIVGGGTDQPSHGSYPSDGLSGEKKKDSGNLIVILLAVALAVVLLATGGFVVYQLFFSPAGRTEDRQEETEETEEIEETEEKAAAQSEPPAVMESEEAVPATAPATEEAGASMENQPVTVKGQILSDLPNARYSFTFENTLDGARAVIRQGDTAEGYNGGTLPQETEDSVALYEDGVDGKAVYLDGTYGLRLDNVTPVGTTYTVSFWVNAEEYENYTPVFEVVSDYLGEQGGAERVVLNKKQNEAGDDVFPVVWSCRNAEDSALEFHPWYENTSNSSLALNTWHHIVLVVEGDRSGNTINFVQGTLFVNGDKVASGDVAKTAFDCPDSRVYLGLDCWDKPFRGSYDDLKIWDCALSEAQVKTLYQAYQ